MEGRGGLPAAPGWWCLGGFWDGRPGGRRQTADSRQQTSTRAVRKGGGGGKQRGAVCRVWWAAVGVYVRVCNRNWTGTTLWLCYDHGTATSTRGSDERATMAASLITGPPSLK